MSIDPNRVGATPKPVGAPFAWTGGGDNGQEIAMPEGQMSFGDLLDIVNPLQHIPGVGAVYRSLTGDTISTPARILGGTLFGGPVGMLAAAAESGWEADTGRSFGGSLLAAARGEPARLIDPVTASPIDAALAQAVPERAVVPTIAGVQVADASGVTGTASDAVIAAAAATGIPTIAAQAVVSEPLAPPQLSAATPQPRLSGSTSTQIAQAPPTARIPYAASPYAQPAETQARLAPKIMDYDQAVAGVTGAPMAGPSVSGPSAPPAPVDPQSLMGGSFSGTGVMGKTGLPSAGAATPAAAVVKLNGYAATNPAAVDAATAAAGPGLDAGSLNAGAAPSPAAVATQAPPRPAAPGMALPQRTVSAQNNVPPALERRETKTSESFVPPPRSEFVSAQRRDQRAALAQPASPAPRTVQQAAPRLTPATPGPTANGVAGPPTPPANVTDSMMKALEKYDALMRSRKPDRSSNASGVAPIDTVL